MNQIWQKTLAKHLKIDNLLSILIGVFIRKVRNCITGINQQFFGVANRNIFGTKIKTKLIFKGAIFKIWRLLLCSA
jgi:hypothetical protein